MSAAIMQVSDERDEALEEALNFINQAAQRWHNRFTLENLRLSERYIKGELGLAFEAASRFDGKEIRAFFQLRPDRLEGLRPAWSACDAHSAQGAGRERSAASSMTLVTVPATAISRRCLSIRSSSLTVQMY